MRAAYQDLGGVGDPLVERGHDVLVRAAVEDVGRLEGPDDGQGALELAARGAGDLADLAVAVSDPVAEFLAFGAEEPQRLDRFAGPDAGDDRGDGLERERGVEREPGGLGEHVGLGDHGQLVADRAGEPAEPFEAGVGGALVGVDRGAPDGEVGLADADDLGGVVLAEAVVHEVDAVLDALVLGERQAVQRVVPEPDAAKLPGCAGDHVGGGGGVVDVTLGGETVVAAERGAVVVVGEDDRREHVAVAHRVGVPLHGGEVERLVAHLVGEATGHVDGVERDVGVEAPRDADLLEEGLDLGALSGVGGGHGYRSSS